MIIALIVFGTTKLPKINNMRNFFNINILKINSTNGFIKK
jgi:hypothetical protein